MKQTLQSYLYCGFEVVDRLPSIICQRAIQKEVLDAIPAIRPSRVLSIGCGLGGELDQVFEPHFVRQPCDTFVALDISPLSAICIEGRLARALGVRFQWHEMDFKDFLSSKCGQDSAPFDLIQCGFVLHDIDWSDKDTALSAIRGSCALGGFFILSDIFVQADHRLLWREYSQEVEALYDRFISEAARLRDAGDLSVNEYRGLIGDESNPGLMQTQRDAVAGRRDFFESVETTVSRLERAGFRVRSTTMNPLHQNLFIIIAQAVGDAPVSSNN